MLIDFDISIFYFGVCGVGCGTQNKTPVHKDRGLVIGCLAVTYFHTGIRTIIGAGSFHCPVRDGKEWDQTAMTAKLNF